MKRDPYKNKERWEAWKEKTFTCPPEDIRKDDWAILVDFLKDMELGLNVPKEKKGKREAGTLLNLSSHNKFFLLNFKKPLLKLTKKDLHKLESDIHEGKILKQNGKKFTSFGNYIKDFKVFWNWGLRTKKFSENIIEDISSKTEKPSWVYLTEEEIKRLFNKLDLDYKTLCFFLYDSGMRVTEANSIQIKSFNKDFTQVTISDEVAKTFGRTINLKLSSQLLKEYVKEHELSPEDYLLQKQVFTINKYLRYHSTKLFGEGISHPKARGKYSAFTMYDIRHNSACFWFNKYPTHKGLMYRFGWRKADKIEYYSDFLGVSDEITDSDMIIGEDKTKLVVLERELRETNERLSKYMEHRDFALEEVEKMKEEFKRINNLVNNPEIIKKIVEVHNRKINC
jgi:integrase